EWSGRTRRQRLFPVLTPRQYLPVFVVVFLASQPATTQTYALSLHDALPISGHVGECAISWIVSALERSRHNVFEMKTVAAANLGGAAILTTSACWRLHKSTKRLSRWRQVTTRWLVLKC